MVGDVQRDMAVALGIGDYVDFCVNAPFQEVQQLLAGAVGGLHTMQDEHFGISIVEYMAAGGHASFQYLCSLPFGVDSASCVCKEATSTIALLRRDCANCT